jgi:hypothetical protein
MIASRNTCEAAIRRIGGIRYFIFDAAIAAIAVFIGIGGGHASASVCSKPSVATSVSLVCEIDYVWTGVRTDFAALSKRSFVFVAYYDQQRFLTVARLDLQSGSVERARLQSRFAGWDSHNAIVMALDGNDIVHVAGNMHAGPLEYFHGDKPLSIGGMKRGEIRAGSRISYPQFLATKGGMGFLYRDGISGDGRWLIALFDGRGWQAPAELFAAGAASDPFSAYPAFYAAADGSYHVAIVWRRPGDAARNFRLSYARTRDLQNWQSSSGRDLSSPLSAESAEVVDETGERAGLLNNQKITVDPVGRPVIVYSKYDSDGRNAIYVTRSNGNGWIRGPVAISTLQHKIKGAGTLPNLPNYSSVNFHDPTAPFVRFGFAGDRSGVSVLDPQSLKTVAEKKAPASDVPRTLVDQPQGLAAPAVTILPVPSADSGSETPRAYLGWTAQSANFDRPRECTRDTPKACQPPPGALRLFFVNR